MERFQSFFLFVIYVLIGRTLYTVFVIELKLRISLFGWLYAENLFLLFSCEPLF